MSRNRNRQREAQQLPEIGPAVAIPFAAEVVERVLDQPVSHGRPVTVNFPAASDAPESAPAQFLRAVRAKLGKTNRTCPRCGLETFLVETSKEQADGSTWRERRCTNCGHVGERLAPAEEPVDSAELLNLAIPR